MRKFAVLFFCAVSALSLYAGDVATFVNLGFSADGSRFVFGQYGMTDGDYRSYSDISCVDVKKNDFVPGGLFSTPASDQTADRDGRGVFAALQNRAAPFMKAQGIDSALQGRALFVQTGDTVRPKELSFRDFDTGASYHVKLNTLVEGSGADVSTCFYLLVDRTGPDGKTVHQTVGNPALKRAGVRDYMVRRVIADASGKSVVFVIEKEVYGRSGSSVRFMVETIRF